MNKRGQIIERDLKQEYDSLKRLKDIKRNRNILFYAISILLIIIIIASVFALYLYLSNKQINQPNNNPNENPNKTIEIEKPSPDTANPTSSTNNKTNPKKTTSSSGSLSGDSNTITNPSPTCIPESTNMTCGYSICGTKTNNCGQDVDCGTCQDALSCYNGGCVSVVCYSHKNPPVVSNLTPSYVTNITYNSATINWSTNRVSTTQVQYGIKNTFLPFSTDQVPDLTINHSVVLTGLAPNTRYYWLPLSIDATGNCTLDTYDAYDSDSVSGKSFITGIDNTTYYDFDLSSYGPVTVTKGNEIYFAVRFRRISGPDMNINVSLVNLPSGFNLIAPISRFNYSNTVFYLYHSLNEDVIIQMNVSDSVESGNYTFQFNAKVLNLSKTIDLTLNVVPVQEIPVPISYTPSPIPIPNLTLWEKNMLKYGSKFLCDEADALTWSMGWEPDGWYYDGTRVAYQIANYTGNSTFKTCAEYTNVIYERYVYACNGSVPGWKAFPKGLEMRYFETGNTSSKQAAILMGKNPQWGKSNGQIIYPSLSRETAYVLDAFQVSEELGEPHNPREEDVTNIALGQMDQWFVTGDYDRVAPFFFALTSEALINEYDKTHDPRIPKEIQLGADWLWNNTWNPQYKSFCYEYFKEAPGHRCTPGYANFNPAPDLNLLVVHSYAWLYKMTGDIKYLQEADQIFEGGVEKAAVDYDGKHFNQNYRLSFDYVNWRKTLYNCTGDSDCNYLTGACGHGVCNMTTTKCETSYNSSSQVCRTATLGECDTSEYCTGNDVSCPKDIGNISGTPCSIGVCNGIGNCIQNDLAAYYPFDNGLFMSDRSSNENNGFCLGNSCPTWTTDGKVNGAYSFDGNDSIRVNDSSAIDPNGPFSISAWVYPRSINSSSPMIVSKYSGNNKGYSLYLYSNTGKPEFSIGNSTVNLVAISSYGIPINSWSYIVGVWNGSYIFVYVNGTLKANASAPLLINNPNELRIGSIGYGGNYFNGTIDEVKIWNFSLSQTDITNEYNQGLGGIGIKSLRENQSNASDENTQSSVSSLNPSNPFNKIVVLINWFRQLFGLLPI